VLHETGRWVETPTSIINVYMRSMHAMQSRMAEEACNNADVVIGRFWRARCGTILSSGTPHSCGEEAAEAACHCLKELVRA